MKNTKHTCAGPMFGRTTPGCPRCDELRSGVKPRAWASKRRERDEQRHAAEIRIHNCQTSGCGPVCTFGEW